MKNGIPVPSETERLYKEKCGFKKTGCGNIYVTTVFNDEDMKSFNRIIAHLGKPGTCLMHWISMISNFTALAFAKGATIEEVINCLTGECGNASIDIKSCSHGMGELLRKRFQGGKDAS